MAKSFVSSAKTAISELRNYLTEARRAKNDVAAQLDAAEAERKTLLSAPLTRADLEAALLRDIQAQQATALENDDLLAELRYSQSRGIKSQLAGDAPSASPFISGKFSQDILDRIVFALGDPVEILKRLKPVIGKIDFRDAGPSLEDRKTRLAALDKTIAGLRDELAEIDHLLTNANPAINTLQEPKTGERREMAPGEWATWRYMPGQQTGFWDWDSRPVVLRPAPNQPIQ